MRNHTMEFLIPRSLTPHSRSATPTRSPSMNLATLVGFLLIILGAIALAFEGISYTKRRETVQVGPIGATIEQKETIPMSPVLGGVALVAGIALVIAGRRGRRPS